MSTASPGTSVVYDTYSQRSNRSHSAVPLLGGVQLLLPLGQVVQTTGAGFPAVLRVLMCGKAETWFWR